MNTATMTGPTTAQPVPGGKGDVSALNAFLRGELSAVETYDQALGKFTGNDPVSVVRELRRIRDEHEAAVVALRARVTNQGGTPSEGAGVWGVFATAVTAPSLRRGLPGYGLIESIARSSTRMAKAPGRAPRTPHVLMQRGG